MSEYDNKQRIIQELVPGKQISLAHIMANPDPILFEKLGISAPDEEGGSAIGVMTISPAETVVIIADLAVKSSGVTLELIDLEQGSLIVTGTVSQVESSIAAVMEYCSRMLGFSACPVTKT